MHVEDISADSGSDERSERHTSDKQKRAAVQKDRPRECNEVVETYFWVVQKLPIAVRQSVLQSIYKEQSLVQFYLDESKRLTEIGDMTYMYKKIKIA